MEKSIDIKPTPEGYARALILILENGNAEGRTWAREQIIKAFKVAAQLNPEEWRNV